MDAQTPQDGNEIGGRKARSETALLRGVVIEQLAEAVQVLFMIDEEVWRQEAGSPHKLVLGVSVPCGPWGYPRHLLVELRPGSRVRIYIDDHGDRSTAEIEPSTIAPVNDAVVAYFPSDSLDGLCDDRRIQAFCAVGRVRSRAVPPVVVV
jgi:hypothetical protein